jgi:hypothetical protein
VARLSLDGCSGEKLTYTISIIAGWGWLQTTAKVEAANGTGKACIHVFQAGAKQSPTPNHTLTSILSAKPLAAASGSGQATITIPQTPAPSTQQSKQAETAEN